MTRLVFEVRWRCETKKFCREEEIRRREEEIRCREEDVVLRKMEAIELKILKVRHQREEDDAEEDEHRSSLSNNSERVKSWLNSNAAHLTSLHPFAKPMLRKLAR